MTKPRPFVFNFTGRELWRFFEYVNIGNPEECWTWKGAILHGYGSFRRDASSGGNHVRAHRMMYAIWNGPVDDNLYVIHSCDNPACVNPKHLSLGTQGDNIFDAWKKKRLRCQKQPTNMNMVLP